MNSPAGGSRQIRRPPSLFSSKSGFEDTPGRVAVSDCADGVGKTLTATSIVVMAEDIVLDER